MRPLPLMRPLFGVQLAYYLSTTFTLALWEVPRTDYWVMQTHHCCTVAAIYYNYISGYQRWGCLIMMLHDINDVIMEVAKCLNYASCHAAANAVFAVFVATWAALRLYAFPAVLIRSTMYDSVAVLGYTPPNYGLLNALLCVLYCFHIYWFGLILRVAYLTIAKGKGEDIREKED
ncbi:ASC1-like protein 1 [Tetrabaena socialis]|uniref:ASC1-like protein 1 n=1 Tax=Tetrabaena socialis TaxID=47790 RepID=A0A2J8AFU5_9CHLO|nr:ASC1-like protein 1 [Tetrabaena socialis]|eukprot:PNH11393.1 ASC1-like protein 1 [Tetrabaena socialis]